MALIDYEGPGQIQQNGRTLAEAMSVRFRVIGNHNRVYTMKKGMSGRSKGPPEFEVSVESAVPVAGLEGDYVEQVINGEYFDITILMAGKRYVVECFMDDAEGSQAARDAAGFTFNAVGGKPEIL